MTLQGLMLLLFYLSLSSWLDVSTIGSLTLSRCPQVYLHTHGALPIPTRDLSRASTRKGEARDKSRLMLNRDEYLIRLARCI